jgi:hypothetical protein
MRGRVISYFAMAYFGMMPIGSLLIGGVSQIAGARPTMLGSGVIALILLAIYWRFLSTASETADATGTVEAATANETTQLLTTNTTKTWKQTARL